MKLADVTELLTQTLPPKSTFLVEVAAQYDSQTKTTKVVAFISIKIVHLSITCYDYVAKCDSLDEAFTKAMTDFKIWFGKTCGFCWGTKRNTTGECPACSGTKVPLAEKEVAVLT